MRMRRRCYRERVQHTRCPNEWLKQQRMNSTGRSYKPSVYFSEAQEGCILESRETKGGATMAYIFNFAFMVYRKSRKYIHYRASQ